MIFLSNIFPFVFLTTRIRLYHKTVDLEFSINYGENKPAFWNWMNKPSKEKKNAF